VNNSTNRNKPKILYFSRRLKKKNVMMGKNFKNIFNPAGFARVIWPSIRVRVGFADSLPGKFIVGGGAVLLVIAPTLTRPDTLIKN
jgi:hypothetical protein